MQIIEAALAFAITMLVLSLTCSSFVELVQRAFLMRQAGLKYMLYQIFDQVLAKYVAPAVAADVQRDPLIADVDKDSKIGERAQQIRKGFVERMSANRAPMGATPKATPSTPLAEVNGKLGRALSLWGGRDMTSLTPSQFMERLGSIDVGAMVKQVNDGVNAAAIAAGGAAADEVDAVLKDVAQKFEAFGGEASTYFQGRARLLSVCVAIALAFAIRVDAIELFNTYLRDPNARSNVIEQTKAVTAQFQAAKEAADSLQKVGGADPKAAQAQLDALQKDLQSTIANTRGTVKQFSDVGLPIGWTRQNATLNPQARTCSKDGATRVLDAKEKCDGDESTVGLWSAVKLFFSLVLGGLLIGLGSPFWYDAVTGLTNIRSTVKDATGGDQATPAAKVPMALAFAPGLAVGDAQTPKSPDRPQPITPVGSFNISRAAQAAAQPNAGE